MALSFMRVSLFSVLGATAVAAGPPEPQLLTVMRQELDRQFKVYSRLAEHPVYYLAYQIVETKGFDIWARWGGITRRRHSLQRIMDLDLRVGSPELDNTHRAAGAGSTSRAVTLGGDVTTLSADMWLESERRYRAAVEQYIKIVTKHAVKVEEEDPSPDFCEAPLVRSIEEPQPVEINEQEWEALARRVSAVFRRHPEILESSFHLSANSETKYFVNSEGSSIVHTRPMVAAYVSCSARAEDGMEFSLYRHYPAARFADLPSEAQLVADTNQMAETLAGLKTAPLVDPFIGPAILAGRAAAVLFHEVLGHRLEGHRQKDESSGQTFTKKMNSRILPEFITVISDPTLRALGGVPLMGFYRYDDEGVQAQRVTLVDKGILRAFMMSRSPVRGFPESNGHGRKRPGRGAVGRQSSLIVEAAKGMPVKRLRQELIRLCKKQNKEYGLIFEDIKGGFTFTGRTVPNAFNVMPQVVRRVYTDGRPDELVRGVDLIGTPLSTLERIVAAATDRGIFNGSCGAESGWVPVSAVSPSLLIAEVEIQRKEKGQERPPLLPQPGWNGGPDAR